MPYLTGGISIAVLAVGSTAPGLLQFFINKYAQPLLHACTKSKILSCIQAGPPTVKREQHVSMQS